MVAKKPYIAEINIGWRSPIHLREELEGRVENAMNFLNNTGASISWSEMGEHYTYIKIHAVSDVEALRLAEMIAPSGTLNGLYKIVGW